MLGISRDLPEIIEENTRYVNSETGSSYRRRVHSLISQNRIRVEEQERIELQEQEQRDRYRRTSRIGRRRNEHWYPRNREGDDDMPDWTRRLFH